MTITTTLSLGGYDNFTNVQFEVLWANSLNSATSNSTTVMVTESVARIPLGVADVPASVGYIVDKAERLVALSLSSGEVLAQSEFPATPLLVHKGIVVGWRVMRDQANPVHVFAATRKGGVLESNWHTALDLPDWVDVGGHDAGALSLDAKIDGRFIDVTWEAHSSYGGGAPPSADVENAATHDELGTIRFELDSGAVRDRQSAVQVRHQEQALPEVGPGRQVVPYRYDLSWRTQSWGVGSVEAFFARPDSTSQIVLVRRDSESDQAAKEIALTNDPAAEVFVTPDGRFVFVHEPGARGPAWQVFVTDTGDRLSSLPFDPGTESVSVVDERVVYLVVEQSETTAHRSLRCRQLRTGEALWSHQLDQEMLRAAPSLPR